MLQAAFAGTLCYFSRCIYSSEFIDPPGGPWDPRAPHSSIFFVISFLIRVYLGFKSLGLGFRHRSSRGSFGTQEQETGGLSFYVPWLYAGSI